MPGGKNALLQKRQHLIRQSQQAQSVGDGGPGLAHLLSYLLLGQTIFIHQDLIASSLLGRIQVLPLEVFNQAQLHDLPVIRLNNDVGQPGGLGRPPPAFTGDNLIVAGGQPPNRKGLNNAVDSDRFSEIGQCRLVKSLSRLVQSRLDLGNGQGYRALALGLEVRVAQQGVKTTAQPQFFGSFCHNKLLFQSKTSGAERNDIDS